MEVLGSIASVVAIVQIIDRVAGACKSYVDAFHDYPRDLRLIYVETLSLKAVFQSLDFLDPNDPDDAAVLQALKNPDGPVKGCKEVLGDLDKLLPRALPQISRKGGKRQRLDSALVALAWPLKSERARKLLDDLMLHKSTISMMLDGKLM